MSTLLQADKSNFRAGRMESVKYIVVHYTANNGDTARGNAIYFHNNENLNASAHYFVDENEAVQSVKEVDTAWHCGAKTYKHLYCRNNNSLGVELCSRKDSAGKYYFKAETVAKAVALVKSLMAKYGIDIEHVLRHYDVTGKNCPAPFVEDEGAWRAFKAGLKIGEETEMPKTTVVYTLPDGQKLTDHDCVNLDGSIKGSVRLILEALGYKVTWHSGNIIVSKA